MNIIYNFFSQLKRIHTNIFMIGIVGFLTNFTASIVHTTSILFIGDSIISGNLLILIRNLSEALANFYKIFGGMISDYCKKRRIFLIIGYAGVTICKIFFTIVTLKKYISIKILIYIYCVTQIVDRCMNAMRDPARDAIILETVRQTDPEFINISFGMRKFITSLGSVMGGIFTFFFLIMIERSYPTNYIYATLFTPIIIISLILSKYLQNLYINLFVIIGLILLKYLSIYCEFSTILYGSTIFPVALATLLIIKKVQDIKISTPYPSSLFSFKYIWQNYKDFKNVFILIVILVFASFGRICDLAIFKRGMEAGIASYKVPLMFVVLYMSIAVFSYLLSNFKNDSNYTFKTMFFCLSSLLMGNIILYTCTNKLSFWIGLILISGYLSLMDGIMSSIISRYIPNSAYKATVFGVTYGLTGLFLMLNGVFTYVLRKYIFHSFQHIHGVMCIPIFLAISILIYYRKELV